MTEYISYLRVSTNRQEYGLDAQRAAVSRFVEKEKGVLIGEYYEKESGSKNDRPELEKAIADVKARGAVLLIAKLDRLSRSASFLLNLRDSGVPFICADMPGATDLTVGVMAIVAEEERKMISKRTKEGLAAAVEKGVQLGRPTGIPMPEGFGQEQAEGRARKYRKKHAAVLPIIKAQRESGMTYVRIAEFLNTIQINGVQYDYNTVRRLYVGHC